MGHTTHGAYVQGTPPPGCGHAGQDNCTVVRGTVDGRRSTLRASREDSWDAQQHERRRRDLHGDGVSRTSGGRDGRLGEGSPAPWRLMTRASRQHIGGEQRPSWDAQVHAGGLSRPRAPAPVHPTGVLGFSRAEPVSCACTDA